MSGHKLHIKVFLVGKGPVCEFDAPLSTKVKEVMTKVTEAQPTVLYENQTIFYAGKRCEPEKTLEECDVPAKAATITLLCTHKVKEPSVVSSPATIAPLSPSPTGLTLPDNHPPRGPDESVSTPTSSSLDVPVRTTSSGVSTPLSTVYTPPLVDSSASAEDSNVDDLLSSSSSSSSGASDNSDVVPAPTLQSVLGSVDNQIDSEQLIAALAATPLNLSMSIGPTSGKVTELLTSLFSALRASVPPVPVQQQMYALSMEPFVGQIKQAADLELGQIPNYDKLNEIVSVCNTRRLESSVPSYVEATKAKFEKVIADLKQTRNLPLVDQLLHLQAELSSHHKDIIDRPPIVETLSDNQKQIDKGLHELRALMTAYQQSEIVFDSKTEQLARDILPRCEDIERLANMKLDQLNSLREIYGGFAPSETEAAVVCQPVKAIAQMKEKDKLVCEQDLETLKKVFQSIEQNELARRNELERQSKSAQRHAMALNLEQTNIIALIAKLTQRFHANEHQLRIVAAKETSANKEMEARAGLLVDASIEVREREYQLQQRIKDLSAAILAIQDFEDGVAAEMHSLDVLTEKNQKEYLVQLQKTLEEKHTSVTQHYHLVYKKVHALKTFKVESAVMLEELESQILKWSSLKRANMVDNCKAQIEKCQQELKSAELEIEQLSNILSRLDGVFQEVNDTVVTLGGQALQHPKDLVEVECLESDIKRLAREEEEAAVHVAAAAARKSEVSARLQASRLAASINTPPTTPAKDL